MNSAVIVTYDCVVRLVQESVVNATLSLLSSSLTRVDTVSYILGIILSLNADLAGKMYRGSNSCIIFVKVELSAVLNGRISSTR